MIKDSPKHPNCNKELYYSQENLEKIEKYRDPNWIPDGEFGKVYNKK